MDQTANIPQSPQGLADALGDVRAQIKTLKARETLLRNALLEARLNGPVGGAHFEVTVRRSTRRILDKEQLPKFVLVDDRFWKTSETQIVVTKKLRTKHPAGTVPAEDEFDVFEPF